MVDLNNYNEGVSDSLIIGEEKIHSRLWLGSSMYPSPDVMSECFSTAQPGFITASLRRQTAREVSDNGNWQLLQNYLQETQARLLPNTAGCHSAREAIQLAVMARELFATRWIKLEVIGDQYSLQPHTLELVDAARELVSQGFNVLPYCTDDLVLCEALLNVGCKAVMPWAAPIGTGKGLLNPYQLNTLRHRLPEAVLVIDAGIGKPSQAMAAMELGFDAVLLNTAVAKASYPVLMAAAFAKAVEGGRTAYLAGTMHERDLASPSTPVAGLPFWHRQRKGEGKDKDKERGEG
ncbi:MAG: thiazole synthase [Thalassolituus sp.]